MTRPDDPTDPTDPTADRSEPAAPPTPKEPTMFSPDTLRTLDAIGFPLDPVDRHTDDRADLAGPDADDDA